LNATIQDGLLKRFFFSSSNKNKMSSEQTAIKATYFSIIGNTLAIIKGFAGFFEIPML
jgi:hypothetical protein